MKSVEDELIELIYEAYRVKHALNVLETDDEADRKLSELINKPPLKKRKLTRK